MLKNIRFFPLIFIILISAFLRFYNLLHDSPYFFNPDERNMAIAISRFRLPNKLSEIPICLTSQLDPQPTTHLPAQAGNPQLDTCNLNPRFFAYGQFPLYLAFFSDQVTKPISNLFILQPRPKDDQPLAEAANTYLSTSHPSAIFWLRFWSALSSVLTVLFVYLISKHLFNNQSIKLLTINYQLSTTAAILAAFSPGLIQSAHFGTTESLLTFFFLASTYFSIRLLTNPYNNSFKKLLIHNSCLAGRQAKFIILNSLVVGLAIGTKTTGFIFLAPPLITLMIQIIRVLSKKSKKRVIVVSLNLFFVILLLVGTLSFAIISSPYNVIDFQGFKGTVFGYEMDVAIGKYEAFYTRQFVDTTPILFQMEKIFPYALGWPIYILGSLGFLSMSINILSIVFLSIFQRIKYQVLRIKRRKQKLNILNTYFVILTTSFLFYFLPNAFLFAKWTRFMTPVFPFFAIFAGYFLYVILGSPAKGGVTPESLNNDSGQARITVRRYFNWAIGLLVFISLLPGAAFMSIYAHEDVRVTASRWIWQNIPDKSYLLFETANVIDIPLGIPSENLPQQKNYQMVSFDYYHIDDNKELFNQLLSHLEKADYIFIPSRRIFANYLRLPERYPLVTKYYQLLYSGALGFEKVAEFNSFPQLPISQIGPIGLISNDESAEESFTVFDHPVIRIYKKTKSLDKNAYLSLFSI